MNKLIVSISFLLLSLLCYSQNPNIKFGVQAGLNYSNFRGYNIPASASYSESPAFAYLGGINLEYLIKQKWSLKAELNYERKTQKADNRIEITDNDGFTTVHEFTTKKKYDYLVVPIMLKYSFTEKNSYYLNGGPFIGYLIKSKITSEFNSTEFNTDDRDTTDNNKKMDFGVSVGLGKSFTLNQKSTFYIEIRENMGLSNTSKVDVWNGGSVKTNSLNLIAGYSFN
ncbi:porin family protein [Flavobacterium sp. GT3R68]|uniref:porin family protein n=1 Tax=Flavobacterium sp. GT3R68 TaxID=2594437 RepID=UPI000F85E2B7|nr:porin family protein [Flavobacterium sp. GT3R68]RTY94993.1 PorT family protein [Flavobacterium sp. GSN2]TRW91798.1 PorT family protein [Flavobacterium sp. GT3R68]